MKLRRGFTLIELLVVIAIIALLVSILLPSLAKSKELAKRALCASNLRQQGIAVHTYTTDNNGWLPYMQLRDGKMGSDGLNNPHQAYWYKWGPYRNLGHLEAGGYMEAPRVLFCPSNKDPAFQLSTYEPWPTETTPPGPFGAKGIRVGYYFNPRQPLGSNIRSYQKIEDMPLDRVLGVDLVHNEDAVAHLEGWNVMLPDGSVRYVESEQAVRLIMDAGGAVGNNWPVFNEILDLLEGR